MWLPRNTLTTLNGVILQFEKTQQGAYVAIENIDMRFYTSKNVRNPEDAQDVATKQYADTASKAFIYDKDKYLATGEVLMGGRR